jgi:hypothetical protein
MKKSWHPLLLKNQERVWIEEKKALEEKKKLDQLRKEKEEERQLQELQRLQEEQTGKKRADKLEWMYSTPATGSSQNANELEDYLLGKKRVDKMLTADENDKIGAAHKNFIAVQNANSARDLAAKIREDPLLAIKQQEQAAYQALMSNPLRLQEMQMRNGIKPKKDKKEKKREKHEKKKEKHRQKERSRTRTLSPEDRYASRSGRRESPVYDRYSRPRRSLSPRDPSPPLRSRHDDRKYTRDHDHRSNHRGRSQSRSPDPYYSRKNDGLGRDQRGQGGVPVWPRSSDESEDKDRSRSRSRERGARYVDHRIKRRRSRSFERPDGKRARYSPPPPSRPAPTHPSRPTTGSRRPNDAEERAARLAAMTSSASTLTLERQQRLTALLAKEKAELEAEEKARAKSKGMGGFLDHEQKKVFGGGEGTLEDRIRRGRGGMVVDTD